MHFYQKFTRDFAVVTLSVVLFSQNASVASEEIPEDLSNKSISISIEAQTPLSLDKAIERALSSNHGLAKKRAQARAMEAIPSQAGALPDPMLSLGVMNVPTDTYDLDQEGMTQVRIGISQKFPFPGKRGLKETAAEHMASAANSAVDEANLKLVSKVKHNWWKLFYLDRALETVNRNKSLMRQFINIARTKYKVGKGLQQDVLLAQLELSKLLDKEIQLKSKRRSTESRLNALLNLAITHPVTLPQKVDAELPRIKTEAELYLLAREARPLLAALKYRVEAAQAKLALSKKGYYPDFMLGVSYGSRQDMPNGMPRADFVSVMLSMNIPLYAGRKQSQAVVQRSNELIAHEQALADTLGNIDSTISRSFADYHRASEQFMLFKTGIIPQAHQTVSSMLAGYQVNKVDFLNLVRAQVTLYNFETRYWRSLAEANQALAMLVAAVGKENIHE